MESLVLYDKRESVAWITLNRPSVLNAVNLAMRDELWAAFLAVRDDPDVRVAVISGAGDRAFSAGADVTEFGTAPSYIAARRSRQERDVWGLMLSLDKPLIAAIHGYALGAGCEMSLCCDIRIAAPDARLGLPEMTLGYIPSAGGTQTLPRHALPGLALDLILTAEPIDAARALEAGLVHRVVPREQLLPEAEALARALAQRPSAALSAAKRAVYGGLDLGTEDALALGDRISALLLQAGEREAITRLCG